MNIREADKNDLEALAQSMVNLVRYSQKKLKDPYIDDIDTDHQRAVLPWFKEALNNPEAIVYIAEMDGNVVGFTVGKLARPFVVSTTISQIGHIEVCWVDPHHRGTGLSRLLITKLESWFKSHGIEYVDIYYLESNEEAKQVWSRLGFEPFRVACRKKI